MATITPRSTKTSTSYRVTFMYNGKQRYKQFKTKKLAQRFAENLGTYIASPTSGDSITVSELAAEWLEACRRGRDGRPPLEAFTLVVYDGYVRNWLAPGLGHVKLAYLSPQAIMAFRDSLLAGGLARATAKKVMMILRTMLGYAMVHGYTNVDPSARISVHQDRRAVTRIDIHSKAEMRELIAASVHFPTFRPMFLLLVYSGLRLSEARGLRGIDVDAREGTVHVRQRADAYGEIGSPKSAQGTRRVHVPALVIEALPETPSKALVFRSRTGKPLSAANIRKRYWLPLQQKAGVRELTMHALRHFYASREIENGTLLSELCVDMGHADPAFTLRQYGHLFRDADSEKKRAARAEARVLT